MSLNFQHIDVEQQQDVYSVRLVEHRMDEQDILSMADEVLNLINDHGCRKMILCLGPGEVGCLYSVFLAKLVMIRRHMAGHGGILKIAEATPNTIEVFQACQLKELFSFVPTKADGVAELSAT